MKKLISFLAIFILIGGISVKAQPTDEESIKSLINKAYIEGIHNNGNLDETRKGFHPGFDLLILQNNQLEKLPIYNWIEKSERSRKEDPNQQKPQTTVNYVFIDITGAAAVAKIELFRENKKIFTDYLSLYKFQDGWRIVNKIYFKH